MSRLLSVIDLCSDEEDETLPSNLSSSSASSNTSGIGVVSDENNKAVSERYVLNEVDGIKILEFESEVDMEFYANHTSINSNPDEEFFGFDIKNKPSTILIDFFEKVKKLRLSSCSAIEDTAPPNTVPATASPPPPSSTALSGDQNDVEDDEDCIIVQGESFVPIRPPICKRCGKCTIKKKKVLPSITEVINLDSDEEEIANTSSSNNSHTTNTKSGIECSNNDRIKKCFKEPKIVDKDKTLINVPGIGDEVSSERTLLKRPFSDRAVPLDESVPSDHSRESVGPTSSCTAHHKRIRLDSVDTTSHVGPVKISTTETVSGSMLNQGDEKDMDSHSTKIHSSQARMSTILEARKSQTNIKQEEDMMNCVVSTQEIVSINTSRTSYAMPTDVDEFICLDSDNDTNHVSLKEASPNKALHESVPNQGREKIIESRAKTVCNLSVVPALINAPTLQTKMICNDIELKEVMEVVHDIVDFVCRQEDITNVPLRMEPYVERYSASNDVQNMPSCLKPYCKMGCICYCLRRKCTRNRCLNPDCIFGCICNSILKPRRVTTNRRSSESHSSDVMNEVTPTASTDIIAFESNNNKNKSTCIYPNSKQKPHVTKQQYSRRKQTLAQKKISAVDYIVLELQPTEYNPAINRGGTITPSGTKKSERMMQQSLWKASSICKKKKFADDSTHLQEIVGNNMRLSKHLTMAGKDSTKMSVQTCQQSQILTLTDVPPPDFALTCLTPGIGYIALEEFGSSILRLCDPFEPSDCRTFTSVSLATDWLNYNLKVRLKFEQGVELKWLVANSTMIQIKKIKRFDSRVLLDPRCRITKNGVVFI